MKLIALALIALLSSIIYGTHFEKKPSYESIDNRHALLWKTNIGIATFRSNLSAFNKQLVVGSNGNALRDWNFIDEKSGLYFLSSHNGKIIRSISHQKWGDFDVNGTVVYNNRIYFGNDNEEFICINMNGQVVWKIVVSGDVEAEPVLLDIKGKKAIVYATELGEVKAVDPETGRAIWSYFTPDFNGWREGDSRPIFKVRAFLQGTESFFTKPVAADVNGDGVNDLAYIGYDRVVYCINGINGKLLWSFRDENISFGLFIDKKEINGLPEFWLNSSIYNESNEKYYLSVIRIDKNGKVAGKIPLQQSSHFCFSLNSFRLTNDQHLYATEDSLYLIKDNQVKKTLYLGEPYIYKNSWENEEKIGNRTYEDQIFGTKIFRYKDQDSCIALLSQVDRANYENAFITIISLTSWQIMGKYSLPSSSEMPPQIGDFNGDGTSELLVNCMDGNLYCYQIK